MITKHSDIAVKTSCTGIKCLFNICGSFNLYLRQWTSSAERANLKKQELVLHLTTRSQWATVLQREPLKVCHNERLHQDHDSIIGLHCRRREFWEKEAPICDVILNNSVMTNCFAPPFRSVPGMSCISKSPIYMFCVTNFEAQIRKKTHLRHWGFWVKDAQICDVIFNNPTTTSLLILRLPFPAYPV